MTFAPAPLVGFQSRKAAQIAAIFAAMSDGKIEKLKLIKLIYLSERNFLNVAGHPMLFDEMYSLPHGPICSSTLNGIDGNIDPGIWEEYVSQTDHRIYSLNTISREDADELSDDEFDVICETWKTFGHMTSSEIRKFTHTNCPEYTEVERGRVPISYREMLEALGVEEARELDDEIKVLRKDQGFLFG